MIFWRWKISFLWKNQLFENLAVPSLWNQFKNKKQFLCFRLHLQLDIFRIAYCVEQNRDRLLAACLVGNQVEIASKIKISLMFFQSFFTGTWKTCVFFIENRNLWCQLKQRPKPNKKNRSFDKVTSLTLGANTLFAMRTVMSWISRSEFR